MELFLPNKTKHKVLTETFEYDAEYSDTVDLIRFKFSRFDAENVDWFCKTHSKLLRKKYEAKKPTIIGYDFKSIMNIDMSFLDTIREQHESFHEEYRAVIRCVYIFMNNLFLVKSASVILSMLDTVVPIYIGVDKEDVENDVKATMRA
jgi:hypothetical protein